MIGVLSIFVFIPAFGALLIGLFVPAFNTRLISRIAGFFFFIDFLAALVVAFSFDSSHGDFQMVENALWVGTFGIRYHLGVDGISLLLVVMTSLLGLIACVSSWPTIQHRPKGFYLSLLILQTGMLGTFLAIDLFLFYVFWEIMLIPMYFLIGIWGGPRKLYAAIKFVLFTLGGSVVMLVGILALYFIHYKETGQYSFEYLDFLGLSISLTTQKWLFWAFFLAFAVKVPLFPFHTWLPDAHVEAPTAGSVILAGVLLKMGTYGFLRFCLPLFPAASVDMVPIVAWLGIIGIIYGALVAMVQEDIKKLVAYSSVSHLGLVVVGMFALNTEGITGSLLQMVNHGLSTGALFLLVGMIYERRHTRMIRDFGGLAKVMPVYAALFLIVTFSSIGVPGLNGFVGEFLVLVGVFRYNHWYAVFAATGVILSACYMLWMVRRVFFGPVTHPENAKLKDVSRLELATLVPIVVLIFLIGVLPMPFLNVADRSVEKVVSRLDSARAALVLSTTDESSELPDSRLALRDTSDSEENNDRP